MKNFVGDVAGLGLSPGFAPMNKALSPSDFSDNFTKNCVELKDNLS